MKVNYNSVALNSWPLRPTTPVKGETNPSNRKESVTPKMEDFGLSMNRVNLFLKKGVPPPFQHKALDDSDSDRFVKKRGMSGFINTISSQGTTKIYVLMEF